MYVGHYLCKRKMLNLCCFFPTYWYQPQKSVESVDLLFSAEFVFYYVSYSPIFPPRPLLWTPCWMILWCLPRSCETWASLSVWRWSRTSLMASSACHSSPRRRRLLQKSAQHEWSRCSKKNIQHVLFASGQSWKRLTRVLMHQADLSGWKRDLT